MNNVITGSQIRAQYDELAAIFESLDEQYMKPDDPSVAVLSFLERVSSSLGAVKHTYAQTASDRNTLPGAVKPYIDAIREACNVLAATLAAGTPEDTNRVDQPWGG